MYPIKSAGYEVKPVNLCKTCHKKADKKLCGEHYSSKNRYKKVAIHNMKIVKKIKHHSNQID
jgi:hypothetical protein